MHITITTTVMARKLRRAGFTSRSVAAGVTGTRDCLTLMARARRSLGRHDVRQLPCPVEQARLRGVEAHHGIEALAREGLDPVGLRPCGCASGGAEVQVDGPIGVGLELV